MEELVKQAKMGNDEAFTQLIIQMQCEMFRIAQIRLKNIDDANDAIQQTNLYAYKNLRQLKEDKYFKTWIIKILINECNKVYKKNYKILNIFDKLTKEHNSEEDFKVTENIEEKMDLEGILSTLKYEDAICIVLFYGSGYTIREISEILKCNENTVKSRINRVKGKIRKNYSKGGMENEISR
mgnify:FL=1